MKKIFFYLILTFTANVICGQDKFAGIEIGSTGVKFGVISLRRERDKVKNLEYFNYQQLEQLDQNTKFVQFTGVSTENTVLAVEDFYKLAKHKYSLDDKFIYICVSHGVVSQCIKKDQVTHKSRSKTLADLTKRIEERLPDYAKQRCIGLLNDKQEPKLTVIGVVAPEYLLEVALVDVGSGNTKGGHFISLSQNFAAFDIPIGSGSLKRDALKMSEPYTINLYIENVKQLVQNNDLLAEMRAAADQIKGKSNIILTGGIGWAIARITKPFDVKDVQPLTIEDIDNVLDIASNPEKYKQLKDSAKQMGNDSDFAKAIRVFDDQMLIAGGLLLKRMMEVITQNNGESNFYAYKASYIGWLKGYIMLNNNDNTYDPCKN